jgi:predicted dehydrogenase
MRRREFLKSAVPLIVPAAALGLNGAVPPSDRIVLGHVGVGGMGSGHVRAFLQNKDVQTVAMCDVRRQHCESNKQVVDSHYGNKDCALYNDFRELLARTDIDGVVMAAPDYWHALIGLEAARQRKDIYYEKPMSMSMAENSAMRAAVKRYGIVFQFGTQQRSDAGYRFACEMARNGRLGKLQNIMIGTATAPYSPDLPPEPIPEGFDYDMWLGPAPWAPHNTRRCTRDWTHIHDYSLGCLSGAWGIHDVDIAQWALDADFGGPIEVEATGVFPTEGLFDTAKEFDARLKYANGVTLHLMDMPTAIKKREQFKLQWMTMLFEGSEGWILVSRNGLRAEPQSLLREVIGPNEIRLTRSTDHRRNFLNAVKTRAKPISHIDAAVRSDTVCHLADIGMRLGRKLKWNPEAERFENDEAANRMRSRALRSPWRI